MMGMLVLPAIVLPGTSADTQQMVILAALVCGTVTFAEYNAACPSLIEFRDAAPINRLRYMMLLTTLLGLCLLHPDTILPQDYKDILVPFTRHIGAATDFPFSPVRLVSKLGRGENGYGEEMLRDFAGLAYLIILCWLTLFALLLRLRGWPNAKRPLNLWVNLPLFEPTAGIDVVQRLSAYGRVNIFLGFSLPFAVPVGLQLFMGDQMGASQSQVHSLIWMIALWAFIPGSMILRGLALMRIAELIVQSRANYGTKRGKSLAPV
jgi:hypothetical protein